MNDRLFRLRKRFPNLTLEQETEIVRRHLYRAIKSLPRDAKDFLLDREAFYAIGFLGLSPHKKRKGGE